MAGIVRFGAIRILGQQSTLLSAKNSSPIIFQKCSISGKTMRGFVKPEKPKPWPYKTKDYNVWRAMYDKTTKRLDENSKLIVVEGPIAAGKTKFAKELAEELEMLFVPQAHMDMLYINEYGYDLRQLDPRLPELCRSFDISNFCRDPNHRLVAQMQIQMYTLRYSQYIDALAHILSSGQGVVMDRCAYSDFVFVEAMHKGGYISKGARSVYYEIKKNTIGELLKPHLVIYLDTPVDVVKKNIKKRNTDYEVNSKVFTDEFLSNMETVYKQQYLKDISVHAELLIYDWSAGGETEVVVEDIERINFEEFEKDWHNKKMKDWRFPLEWDWCEARIKYCSEKCYMMNLFNVPRFDVPELIRDAEDGKIWRDVWFNAPGMKYNPGYNADMGDKGLLTKIKFGRNNTL